MNKWDDFEPYKGPEKKHLPSWLETIIVKVGFTIGLLIIGCTGAFFPFILASRFYVYRKWLIEASDKTLCIMAASGAVISIITVIIWYRHIKISSPKS